MGFQELLKIIGLELPSIITPKDLDFLSYLVSTRPYNLWTFKSILLCSLKCKQMTCRKNYPWTLRNISLYWKMVSWLIPRHWNGLIQVSCMCKVLFPLRKFPCVVCLAHNLHRRWIMVPCQCWYCYVLRALDDREHLIKHKEWIIMCDELGGGVSRRIVIRLDK
jgi:hypothetical protein